MVDKDCVSELLSLIILSLDWHSSDVITCVVLVYFNCKTSMDFKDSSRPFIFAVRFKIFTARSTRPVTKSHLRWFRNICEITNSLVTLLIKLTSLILDISRNRRTQTIRANREFASINGNRARRMQPNQAAFHPKHMKSIELNCPGHGTLKWPIQSLKRMTLHIRQHQLPTQGIQTKQQSTTRMNHETWFSNFLF